MTRSLSGNVTGRDLVVAVTRSRIGRPGQEKKMRRLLAVTVLVAVLAGAIGCSTDQPTERPPESLLRRPVAPPRVDRHARQRRCGGRQRRPGLRRRPAGQHHRRPDVRGGVGPDGRGGGCRRQPRGRGCSRAGRGGAGRLAAALREQSERAVEPQLKTLLTDIGTEVSALGADVESIDETELDRLQQRLDQLCAR
ncbi:hypothetical protein NKG94_44515 [Micromonospora sp. M12]